MIEVPVMQIRANLAEIINKVAYGGERAVLQRRGKPAAALVSMEDLKLLEAMEDRADIKAAKKARKEKGGITLDQYRKKHGL
jgi:prevent-host-death family protein